MSKILQYTNCLLDSSTALVLMANLKEAFDKRMRTYASHFFDLHVSMESTDDQPIQVISLRSLEINNLPGPVAAMTTDKLEAAEYRTLVRINQNPYSENLWHLHVREDLVGYFDRAEFVLPSKEELAEKLAKN